MSAYKWKDLAIEFTSYFTSIWSDKGSNASRDSTYYQPNPPSGYYALGSYGKPNRVSINDSDVVIVVRDVGTGNTPALAQPTRYEQVWQDAGSGADKDGSFWKPIPPSNYVALGLVCMRGHNTPPGTDAIRCIRSDLVTAGLPGPLLWDDSGSGADADFGAWSIMSPAGPPAGQAYVAPGTFYGTNSHTQPQTDSLLYVLNIGIPEDASARALPLPPNNVPIVQSGYGPDTVQYRVQVPFFAVKDASWSEAQKAANSPFYTVLRTDKYCCQQVLLNARDSPNTLTYTALTGVSQTASKNYAAQVGISITESFEATAGVPDVLSAKASGSFTLSSSFTYGYTTSNTTTTQVTVSNSTTVPPQTAVAIWTVESSYTVVRADGVTVGSGLTFNGPNTVALTQFPLA